MQSIKTESICAPGQRVRIISGPFKDFVGTIYEVDPNRELIRVLVDFMGRDTPVELEYSQVAPEE